MAQTVYILFDEQNEYVSARIFKNVKANEMVYSPNAELTTELITRLAKKCLTKYFYIIRADKEILFPVFNFNFEPPVWDEEYLHIWNSETTVRLFNAESVLKSPEKFCDSSLVHGKVKLKNVYDKIYTYPVFDIVFLSYDEEAADVNYNKLQRKFPSIIRVHGKKGIANAHKFAATLVTTEMFYVVDADAEIVPEFNFDYQPHSLDRESVHVWHSKNPVNDLEYGYGGVKLFPTQLLLDYNGTSVDFTTSVAKKFKVVPEVSNITKFNTDPFSAWRSGFREAAKLASKTIDNYVDIEREERLNIWCTKGADREFGDFAIMGAIAGAEFGKKCASDRTQLELINDFNWLETQFNL